MLSLVIVKLSITVSLSISSPIDIVLVSLDGCTLKCILEYLFLRSFRNSDLSINIRI